MVRKSLAKKALTHIDAALGEMTNLQQGFDDVQFLSLKIQRLIHILNSSHKHLSDVHYNEINRLLFLVLDCEPCMQNVSDLRMDLYALLEDPGKAILFPKNYFHQKAEHIIEQLSQIQFTAKYIGNVKG